MFKKIIASMLVLTMLFAASCETVSTTSELLSSDSLDPTMFATNVETYDAEISATNKETPDTVATEEPTTTTEPAVSSEESTATPTGDPMMEGMMFPDSDERLIMWEELVPLGPDALALARNDFFAREGYVFQKQMYIDHYSPLAWYEPDESFSYDQFNEIQKANILLIQVAEARAGNGLLLIPSGTRLDFDQDGVLETLTYDSPDENTMNLTLHDTSEDWNWSPNVMCPYNRAYIGDIDTDDGMLDLFADEMGPSDDYRCSIAGLTPQGFLDRGRISGDYDDIVLAGDGTLTTTGRMQVMMTWFATVKYVLGDEGTMVFVPDKEYFFGDFPCTALVDIPMRSKQDPTMAADMTIPAGTAVILVSSDNDDWVKIRWGENTGWLFFSCYGTDSADPVPLYYAFDGLIIAD
jgi:YARHG domain